MLVVGVFSEQFCDFFLKELIFPAKLGDKLLIGLEVLLAVHDRESFAFVKWRLILG